MTRSINRHLIWKYRYIDYRAVTVTLFLISCTRPRRYFSSNSENKSYINFFVFLIFCEYKCYNKLRILSLPVTIYTKINSVQFNINSNFSYPAIETSGATTLFRNAHI